MKRARERIQRKLSVGLSLDILKNLAKSIQWFWNCSAPKLELNPLKSLGAVGLKITSNPLIS